MRAYTCILVCVRVCVSVHACANLQTPWCNSSPSTNCCWRPSKARCKHNTIHNTAQYSIRIFDRAKMARVSHQATNRVPSQTRVGARGQRHAVVVSVSAHEEETDKRKPSFANISLDCFMA